jgi:hypothetical protein
MNDTSLTIERMLAPRCELENLQEFQRQLDKIQRVEWIQSMGPWEVMMTGTFRWEASMESGRRCFTKWIRRKLPRVSYYYVLEQNPSRDGFHVHSLWADAQTVYRREMWADWVKRYGRARIEPVRSAKDSADYASKYLTKPNCWWDYFLQWHRQHRVNSSDSASQLLVPLQVDRGAREENESQGGGLPPEGGGGRRDLAADAEDQMCVAQVGSSPPSLIQDRQSMVCLWEQISATGIWEAHYC